MGALEWTELKSSSIRRAAFDCHSDRRFARVGKLLLEFRSGRKYEYSQVPESVFEWLLRVPNKSAYVTRMVVGTYPERELDSGTQRRATEDLEAALRASIERIERQTR